MSKRNEIKKLKRLPLSRLSKRLSSLVKKKDRSILLQSIAQGKRSLLCLKQNKPKSVNCKPLRIINRWLQICKKGKNLSRKLLRKKNQL